MMIFSLFHWFPALFAGIYSFFYFKKVLLFFYSYVKGPAHGQKHQKDQGGPLFLQILPLLLALLIAFLCKNVWSAVALVVLHVLLMSFLLDVAAFVVRLVSQWLPMLQPKPSRYAFYSKVYRCGLLPLLITAIVFTYGTFNMERVTMTEYELSTDKAVQPYTIALLTDTHYDTIQDASALKEAVAQINEKHPDLVLLAGDIVDENTTKESMEEVFQLFGSMDSKFGVYYVYGNHDCQVYSAAPYFTGKELQSAIEGAGITILNDSYVEINDDLILAGRLDASLNNRLTDGENRYPVEKILQGVDPAKYILMMDHQPRDTEENAQAGVDLMVSGHTHAGQIWPVGWLISLMGTPNYGHHQEGSCHIIVSSGVAGWGFPIRTEGHCEYVMLQIQP
ncbi:MAG: metallophosphoesterase [Firmicutes bacterium]|nr:metallophosphoesterase [Bacillota bacterium]